MGWFFKKPTPDEMLDDAAREINKKVDEKLNSSFYKHQPDIQESVDANKLDLLLDTMDETDPFYDWFLVESGKIAAGDEMLRVHIISAISAFLAFLENQNANLPPKLRDMSGLQLLYELYRRCLLQRNQKPIVSYEELKE